jgi:tetratricopeptide (TPR) repeat protein
VTAFASPEAAGHAPDKVAHFLNRIVFCLFAEDVNLLQDDLFKRMLETLARRRDEVPARSQKMLAELFANMRKGGNYGLEHILHFNGGLFDDDEALPLDADSLDILRNIAKQDWSAIDPSIFGTLFERFLDPDKRAQIGAHYTDPEKIMMIVNPVIARPLTAEWEAAKSEIADNGSSKMRWTPITPLRGSKFCTPKHTPCAPDRSCWPSIARIRLEFRVLDGPNTNLFWSTGMPVWFRHTLGVIAIFAGVGSFGATSMASPTEDCKTLHAAAALAPCTLVIEDKRQTPASRVTALLMRARAALDMSELDRAEADIKSAIALRPNMAFGYRVRGRLRGLQGRKEEARADYAQAILLSATKTGKYVSFLDRGNFLLRITELPAAMTDFETAIRVDPTKASAYVGRALTNKAMGHIGEALADLGRAKAVEPRYWVTYVEQGDILVAEKRFAEAIAAYDLALAIRGNDARALKGRAAATALVAQSSEPVAVPVRTSPTPPPSNKPSTVAPAPSNPATPSAVPPEQPATAPAPPAVAPVPVQPGEGVDPAAKRAEERRGKLKEALDLRHKGKHAEAIVLYDALLKQAPGDSEVALQKGRTLMTLAKWKEALEAFKTVVESKTAPPGMKALALEGQGEILARNDLFALAIASTTAALQINPKLNGALFWRGLSSYAIGGFDKALADFEKATSLVPKSALYQAWEALALVGTGDLSKAKEAIDRAFAIQQNNLIALTARARLRLVTGDIDAAETDLSQVARRGPMNSVALQTQQLIMIHKVMKPSDRPLAKARE